MSVPRQKFDAKGSSRPGASASSVRSRPRRMAALVADRLREARSSPALRSISALADSEGVEASQAPICPAHEVLSTWAVRLWNVILTGKRVVGLTQLVRALRELPSEEPIEQIHILGKDQTGIVFFSANSERLIGAIFSTRTDSDERRSRANLLAANGESGGAEEQPVNLRFMQAR